MAVSNYQIDYSGEFPKLIWTGNGGSTRHPYNAFSVIIYAEDGAEVFSKGIIDASSYTFTADEWRKILYGYGETITIEIAAYQTTNFMTGPYYAETTIEKANSTLSYGTMFAFSQRYIESSQTLSPGQVWQYYLYNEAAGWKVIQSFGGKNVMIELRDSNGNFIASDNNSGYENNSFIRYNLQGNTEYLIRIYLYDYKDSGTVKVSIFAAHNLGYHYEGIKNYDNVLISLTYTTYATQGYMQAITFTAPLSGRYKFSLQSTFDNYIYIIDPRSNEILVENINYNDNASGLNASLTIRLNGNVPYLIVFGAKDPSAPFTNFDEGDDLVLKVTRQLF